MGDDVNCEMMELALYLRPQLTVTQVLIIHIQLAIYANFFNLYSDILFSYELYFFLINYQAKEGHR